MRIAPLFACVGALIAASCAGAMAPQHDTAVCDLIDDWAVEHAIPASCADLVRNGLADELSYRPVAAPTALPWGDVLVIASDILSSITTQAQADPGSEETARLCRGAAFEIAFYMRSPAPERPWASPDSALCLLLDRCYLLTEEIGGAVGASAAEVHDAYRSLVHRVTDLWSANHPLLTRDIDPAQWEAQLDAQFAPYAAAAKQWTPPPGALVQHLATSAGGYASKMTAYAALRASPSPRADRSLFPDGGRDKLSVMVELSLPRMKVGIVKPD